MSELPQVNKCQLTIPRCQNPPHSAQHSTRLTAGGAHHCNIKLHLFLMLRPTWNNPCWKQEELSKPLVSLKIQTNFPFRNGRRRNTAQGYLRLLSGCETWCYHGNKCTCMQARATKSVLHVNPDGENQSRAQNLGRFWCRWSLPAWHFYRKLEEVSLLFWIQQWCTLVSLSQGNSWTHTVMLIPWNHLFRRNETE